jgi:hypothetical protein
MEHITDAGLHDEHDAAQILQKENWKKYFFSSLFTVLACTFVFCSLATKQALASSIICYVLSTVGLLAVEFYHFYHITEEDIISFLRTHLKLALKSEHQFGDLWRVFENAEPEILSEYNTLRSSLVQKIRSETLVQLHEEELPIQFFINLIEVYRVHKKIWAYMETQKTTGQVISTMHSETPLLYCDSLIAKFDALHANLLKIAHGIKDDMKVHKTEVANTQHALHVHPKAI